MEETTVLYRRQGDIGIITLNRPHRLNALTGELLKAFMETLDAARRDKDAAVIILTGSGRSFCSGEDLKETAEGKSGATWMDEAELTPHPVDEDRPGFVRARRGRLRRSQHFRGRSSVLATEARSGISRRHLYELRRPGTPTL